MVRFLALTFACLLPLIAIAQVPPPIAARTAQSFEECRSAGGTPGIGEGYQTEAELNGDGQPDYAIYLQGLECANAWSYFCGSAGCPLTVWLSGPGGYAEAWSGYAQGFEIQEKEVVVAMHGSFCDPPRVGSDTCYDHLRFDNVAVAPPAPAPAPAAQQPAPPSATTWELRAGSGAPPVAVVGGPGNLRSLAAFCLNGQPVLAVILNDPPSGNAISLGLGFARGRSGGPAMRGPNTGGTFLFPLRGNDAAARMAGRDSAMQVAIDGVVQGIVTLKGSTAALRGALAGCLRV